MRMIFVLDFLIHERIPPDAFVKINGDCPCA